MFRIEEQNMNGTTQIGTGEKQIRELIGMWANTARTKDCGGIIANHAPDIWCPMFRLPCNQTGLKLIGNIGSFFSRRRTRPHLTLFT
jgi:hypothetical protein